MQGMSGNPKNVFAVGCNGLIGAELVAERRRHADRPRNQLLYFQGTEFPDMFYKEGFYKETNLAPVHWSEARIKDRFSPR